MDSLRNQTFVQKIREVIVISPERYELVDWPDLKVVNIVKSGINQAEARNIGEKSATGSILAFCDDDCVLPPDWIENGTADLSNTNSQVATVGGPSVPPVKDVSFQELVSGSLMVSYLGTGSHQKAYAADKSCVTHDCKPVSIVCSNMFVDRLKFIEVGGFDPIVPQEEDRLNTKFINKGFHVLYDPKLRNTHYQRPWGSRFIRNMFWLMAGQGALTKDRLSPSSKLYLIPPIFAIVIMSAPIFLLLPTLNTLYILLIGLYLCAILGETLRLIVKLKITNSIALKFFFIFPISLFVHHFTSGFGFLYGFFGRFLHKSKLGMSKVTHN